jgi:hypothetical protein
LLDDAQTDQPGAFQKVSRVHSDFRKHGGYDPSRVTQNRGEQDQAVDFGPARTRYLPGSSENPFALLTSMDYFLGVFEAAFTHYRTYPSAELDWVKPKHAQDSNDIIVLTLQSLSRLRVESLILGVQQLLQAKDTAQQVLLLDALVFQPSRLPDCELPGRHSTDREFRHLGNLIVPARKWSASSLALQVLKPLACVFNLPGVPSRTNGKDLLVGANRIALPT